eukprot:GHVT01102609.1.p1 GENE.GHVT01102609.1~~GHVT01102609.1.p1  ORF type:complete len:373 (+),score=79.24 GHVT01102609.1:96-1214(+)
MMILPSACKPGLALGLAMLLLGCCCPPTHCASSPFHASGGAWKKAINPAARAAGISTWMAQEALAQSQVWATAFNYYSKVYQSKSRDSEENRLRLLVHIIRWLRDGASPMTFARDSAKASTMPHLPRGEMNAETGKIDVSWPSNSQNAVCFKILSAAKEPSPPTMAGNEIAAPFCFAEKTTFDRVANDQQTARGDEQVSNKIKFRKTHSKTEKALPFAAAPAAPVPRAPSSSSSRISKKPRRKSREGKRKHPPQNYSQELPSIMEPLPTLHEDLQDPANGGNVGLTQLMNDAAMLEDSAALPGNDALSFLEKIDQDSVAATDAGDNELAENISMPATDTEVEDNFTLSDLAPGVAFETTGGAWEEESDLWTE